MKWSDIEKARQSVRRTPGRITIRTRNGKSIAFDSPLIHSQFPARVEYHQTEILDATTPMTDPQSINAQIRAADRVTARSIGEQQRRDDEDEPHEFGEEGEEEEEAEPGEQEALDRSVAMDAGKCGRACSIVGRSRREQAARLGLSYAEDRAPLRFARR